MKIVTKWDGDFWTAIDEHAPGFSPRGDGKTEAMAIACLFSRLIRMKSVFDPNILEINGELWRGYSYRD